MKIVRCPSFLPYKKVLKAHRDFCEKFKNGLQTAFDSFFKVMFDCR